MQHISTGHRPHKFFIITIQHLNKHCLHFIYFIKMNSALVTFALTSFVISVTAMTSFYSTRFTGRSHYLPSPFNGNDNEFKLPAELEALIASVSADDTELALNQVKPSAVRYYASYSGDKMCSSKDFSSFEIWEESFGSLEDCCHMAFSWDLNACLKN